jgi:hypothetical protein
MCGQSNAIFFLFLFGFAFVLFFAVIPHLKYYVAIRYLYSDWLWAEWSGDRIPVGARFFTHVQTGRGVYPASCTMGTGSFLGLKRLEHGANHPPLAMMRSRMSRPIPLLPLSAFGACNRADFALVYDIEICNRHQSSNTCSL